MIPSHLLLNSLGNIENRFGTNKQSLRLPKIIDYRFKALQLRLYELKCGQEPRCQSQHI